MTLSPKPFKRILTVVAIAALPSLTACGGSAPPPKTDDNAKDDAPKRDDSSGGPVVEQELGSIDQRAVEVTFDKLQGKLEGCHKQGRERVEYLSGDMKIFLRVGKDGRVKYGFFDESTIGDRDTEKCILDLFAATDWPKPKGGEAEVRNGFGWSAGGERQPTPWTADKVASALEEDKEAVAAIDKCKSGLSGEFRVTAYVEPGEVEGHHGASEGAAAKPPPKNPPKKHGKKGDKKGAGKGGEHGGKFKSIGVAAPGKDGAEKIDCIVDAIKGLSLPSPGSYAAKVTFTL